MPLSCKYPMYAMRVADFLALERMLPHQELQARGLVVPLDMDAEHEPARVHFISHQWLGFRTADPHGVHLRCMQDVFRRTIAGESLFSSEEDWHAYAKGLKADGMRDMGDGLESRSFAFADFVHAIESGWVWIDYMCIPQIHDGLTCEREIRQAREDQAKSIDSIAYYIINCYTFWVCAPSGAEHEDSEGLRTDYSSWARRGWCRFEESAYVMSKALAGYHYPILVTQPVGDVPGLTVRDAFDRMLVYCQRHNAALVGEYSCCQKGHEVADADGRVTRIVCDKIAVRKVLADLLDHSLGQLREATLRNPEFDRTSAVWDAVRRDSSFSFGSFMLLSNMKCILQAESADEQDWVALGWSLPVEEIGEVELARYWEERCLGWPQPPSAMLVPAFEGNLPMLRYFIERLGYSAACHNPVGGATPLQVAARGGYASMVRYLCERPEIDVAHINYTTSASGLSALGDAAMRSHSRVLEVLLSHRADVNIRRNNGKTPLHAAAEEGHVDCVEVLLAANADVGAKDDRGCTAAELALSNAHRLRSPEVCQRIAKLLDATMADIMMAPR